MSKTVLVIEDNKDIRDNIIELLDLTGYQTLQAENGKDGVKLALDEHPDLIICDIMMPVLDGYGVIHILGKHRETIDTPFIFLTAKSEKEDIRKGLVLGADDYLIKPFDETELLELVAKQLQRREESSGSNRVISSGEFDELFENKVTRHFDNGDFVYREGDTPSYLYYLASGKVKLIKTNQDGKEAVLDLCHDGDFFGYWNILEERDQTETAEVLSNTEIWMIPVADFKRLLQENNAVSQRFLKLLSGNLLIKETKILELAYESVRKRIANALVSLCDIYGANGELTMKIPRELIASMAGTSVETAIRMLSEFKKDGYIAINGSEIKMLNYDKLKKAPF
jgi:CRP-like cAMP-binding protein/CheY-like chemotaxis protein